RRDAAFGVTAQADLDEPGEAAVAAVRDEYRDADEQRAPVGVVEPLVDLLGRGGGVKRRAHTQPLVAVGASHRSDMHRGRSAGFDLDIRAFLVSSRKRGNSGFL